MVVIPAKAGIQISRFRLKVKDAVGAEGAVSAESAVGAGMTKSFPRVSEI